MSTTTTLVDARKLVPLRQPGIAGSLVRLLVRMDRAPAIALGPLD
jgi:hypothetical protein